MRKLITTLCVLAAVLAVGYAHRESKAIPPLPFCGGFCGHPGCNSIDPVGPGPTIPDGCQCSPEFPCNHPVPTPPPPTEPVVPTPTDPIIPLDPPGASCCGR